MRVNVIVSVDGVPVTGLFFQRLVSLTITDREGIRSDTLEIVFSDDAPHFTSPRRGAVVSVTILAGGAGGSFVGSFVIDRVEFSCLPHKITVGGHSADLRSNMKAKKSRHWDGKSVADIVAEIASGYDLQVKISEAVSGHVYDWIGQQDESDLNFLERLAHRHGALFTIKNGSLLWLERGAGKTADGTSVPAAVVLRSDVILGSCRVSETDVDRFGKVTAVFQDRAGAKRGEVTVVGDVDADGEHVMRDPLSSQAAAQAAAEAFAREMMRGLVKTSCAIVGRPALMAGQPLTYLGVRPGIDGRAFITELVKHSFTKGAGLRTTFEGKLKAE
jgi:phage protein D